MPTRSTDKYAPRKRKAASSNCASASTASNIRDREEEEADRYAEDLHNYGGGDNEPDYFQDAENGIFQQQDEEEGEELTEGIITPPSMGDLQEDENLDDEDERDVTNHGIITNQHQYQQEETEPRIVLNFDKVSPTFDILTVIDDCINQQANIKPPADAGMPICESSSLSKEAFCMRLNAICRDLISQQQKDNLLALLQQAFGNHPGVYLPQRPTRRNMIKLDVDRYDAAQIRMNHVRSFHVCVRGCSVFAENELQCDICHELRFRPCSKCEKRRLPLCICPFEERKPRKSLLYRSLCSLIQDALEHEWFVPSLLFQFDDHQEAPGQPARPVRDFTQSKVAQEAMMEMKSQYAQYCQSLEVETTRPAFVPLLLSIFYDGAQVCKRKTSVFWPLIIGIENLPPHIRGNLGSGRFLISLFTARKDTASEEFLVRDCLVPELERLYHGWITVDSSNTTYFVVARLVLHLLDTKALEKYFKVQACGTYSPCFKCRSVAGTRPHVLDRNVLYNHRALLDEKHFLRFLGQTRGPAPADFYEPDRANLQEVAHDPHSSIYPPQSADRFNVKVLDFAYINGQLSRPLYLQNPALHSVSPIMRAFIHNRATVGSENFIAYHTDDDDNFDFDRGWWDKDLYFRFCELRPKREHALIHDNIYILNGRTAEELRTVVNGVKGISRLFQLLNVSLCHCPWDLFHLCGNCIKHGLKLLSDDRPFSQKVRTYCLLIACHPGLAHSITATPWSVNVNLINRLESWLNCIIVPPGRKNDFQLADLFTHFGQVRLASFIQIATCGLFEIMMLLLGNALPLQYKVFYWLLSRVISDVHADEMDKTDIAKLSRRALEVIVGKEGLYPESEATIVSHQLVDALLHFPFLGTARGTNTRSGERVVGKVTRMYPQGSPNADKTLFSRYISFETSQLRRTYGPFSAIDSKASHVLTAPSGNIYVDELRNITVYDRYACFSKSLTAVRDGLEMNEYQMDSLLEELMKYMRDYCIPNNLMGEGINNRISWCLRSLPLFRIIFMHQEHKHRNTARIPKHFVQFIQIWGERLSSNEAIGDGYDAKITDDDVINLANRNFQSLINYFAAGRLLRSDVNCLLALYNDGLKVAPYQNADLMGISFQGRGLSACERGIHTLEEEDVYGTEKPFPKRHLPTNPHNRLAHNWLADMRRYRCWCKLKRRPEDGKIKSQTNVAEPGKVPDVQYAHYGCINYFMQLVLSEDVLQHNPNLLRRDLQGAIFGVVTCRKAPYIERVPVVSGWDVESFCANHSFVSIRRIEIGNIMMLAFDKGKVDDTDNRTEYGLRSAQEIMPRHPGGPWAQPIPNLLRTSGYFDEIQRGLNVGTIFRPFFVRNAPVEAKAKRNEIVFSQEKNRTKLGGVFPIELDRGHVGTKPWTAETVASMNQITAHSRQNAVRLKHTM